MHTEARLSEIRNAITRVEHQIAAEGGAFTRNRDSHVTKREEARTAISMLEHQPSPTLPRTPSILTRV